LSPRVDLLGLPLAFAAGGFLGSIVYQASVTDTATLLGLATIVASIGLPLAAGPSGSSGQSGGGPVRRVGLEGKQIPARPVCGAMDTGLNSLTRLFGSILVRVAISRLLIPNDRNCDPK
jgi:hypothetical protein